MDTFLWDDHFVTGLTDVDQQHRHLVKLINQFGALLVDNIIAIEDIEGIFQELTSYTQYHFEEEEQLMTECRIDQRHLAKHMNAHHYFLQEVVAMHESITPEDPQTLNHLLEFLTHWLVFHMLGSDQNMARQIEAIRSGTNPQDAFLINERKDAAATGPLLLALNGLFSQVSQRNKELRKLNRSLERKVAERTRELTELNLHLEALALSDMLTGLPNRRYAMKTLASLWKDSTRTQKPLVCMMIDADHFKEVNDTFGHDAGDLVLRELSTTLKESLRNDDIVCRLGGDEFLVICPGTDRKGGMHIAGILHDTVSQVRVKTGNRVWQGSISVGVAIRTSAMKDYEELIKVADNGVYTAKKDGKNCVRAGN